MRSQILEVGGWLIDSQTVDQLWEFLPRLPIQTLCKPSLEQRVVGLVGRQAGVGWGEWYPNF